MSEEKSDLPKECTKCGSTNLTFEEKVGVGLNSVLIICEDCGHRKRKIRKAGSKKSSGDKNIFA